MEFQKRIELQTADYSVIIKAIAEDLKDKDQQSLIEGEENTIESVKLGTINFAQKDFDVEVDVKYWFEPWIDEEYLCVASLTGFFGREEIYIKYNDKEFNESLNELNFFSHD